MDAALPLAGFDNMTGVTGAAPAAAWHRRRRMPDDRLQIAVVMDPIEDIKPAKDTTLAMMLAAQRRGWGLSYLELGHLWLRDGVALGRAHPLEVRDVATD